MRVKKAHNTSVTVVIPTFNGKALHQKHLPAVLDCLRPNDELLIVDDASTDDTLSYLCSQFSLKEIQAHNSTKHTEFTAFYQQKKITVIALTHNSRFAAAANTGFAQASSEVVFLLNNDVSPDRHILDHTLSYFTDDTVFGVGCLEYQDADKKTPPSGKNVLFFKNGLFQHSKAEKQTRGETAWISGGSGFFSKKKWLELGGFTQDFYPAYWEDIEISYRAQQKGWKTLFEPQAVVYHIHESTNASVFGLSRIAWLSWRHACTFTRKYANSSQRIEYYFWWIYWYFQMIRHHGWPSTK